MSIRTSLYRRTLAPIVHRLFYRELVKRTDNFGTVTWLGQPIWQPIGDAWLIQEAIAELKPALLIETGTNRGGSALYYANLFDALGKGEVITVDVETMHDLSHPRIAFLIGSSTDPEIVRQIRERATQADGPVMVILDSDHSEPHVKAELDAYSSLVTPGSLMLVQDGVIDTMRLFRQARPGPLPALRSFLDAHPEFTIEDRAAKFLVTHHPDGWLRRDQTRPAK
jgi:cephalosporin hydroxylase